MKRPRVIALIGLTFLSGGCSEDVKVPTIESLTGTMLDMYFEPSKQFSAEFLEAVKNGEAQLVDEFLDADYDRYDDSPLFVFKNLKDENGWSPLLWAAHFNHLEIVKELLLEDADPDARANDGTTALHLAVRNNNAHMVRALLRRLQEVDYMNDEGITPLMMAVSRNNLEIAELLLDEGASLSLTNLQGDSALDMARKAGGLGSYRRLQQREEWVLLGSTDEEEYFAHSTSREMRPDGNARIWIKWREHRASPVKDAEGSLNEEENNETGAAAKNEGLMLVECRCGSQEIKVLERHSHDEDKRRVKEKSEGGWSRVLPDTVGLSWYFAGCAETIEGAQT